jgi:hypothetical protein
MVRRQLVLTLFRNFFVIQFGLDSSSNKLLIGDFDALSLPISNYFFFHSFHRKNQTSVRNIDALSLTGVSYSIGATCNRRLTKNAGSSFREGGING